MITWQASKLGPTMSSESPSSLTSSSPELAPSCDDSPSHAWRKTNSTSAHFGFTAGSCARGPGRRSEERRVGKECRSGWEAWHEKEKLRDAEDAGELDDMR